MDEKEQIKKAADAIFPSPEVASKFVDMIVTNRPHGWSRHSNAPYYKEVYALHIKREIDKMIQSGNPIVFRYNQWCEEGGMTPNTLYTRINQSIRYLIEKLDRDGKYKLWYEGITIRRKRGVGIRMDYVAGLCENATSLVADEVETETHTPKWKRDLDYWLESDNTTPFCQQGLALTPEEILSLKRELGGLSNVQCSIKSESVKVIKVNV